jgi:hypothetical protein
MIIPNVRKNKKCSKPPTRYLGRGGEREREVNWKGVLSIFMENKWMKITCDCG